MKKIIALLLALMMALGMVSALAENSTLSDNQATDFTSAKKETDTLTISKAILIVNPLAGHVIAYPTIAYNYTISAPTAEQLATTYVKDNAGNQAAVLPGKVGASKGVYFGENSLTGTITIASSTVTVSEPTKESGYFAGAAKGDVTLNVNAANHQTPGIYRYIITDNTTEGTRAAAGIVRASGVDTTYYLDVYVYKDETDNNKLKLGGYVLHNEDVGTSFNQTQVGKDSGMEEISWDNSTDSKLKAGSQPEMASNDTYYTYNTTLDKTVTGSMGDTTNGFKFGVTVSNQIQDLGYKIMGYENKAAAEQGTALTAANDQSGTNGTKLYTFLKNGQTATIIGLSPKAQIAYEETNNTVSIYTTTAKDKQTTPGDVTLSGDGYADDTHKIQPDKTAAAAAVKVTKDYSETADASAAYTLNDGKESISFTNDLGTISPTGVVLRFAPYFAMFAAGLALFIILATKRSKKEEEE